MTDADKADLIVSLMLRGGWNHESVFKAPAEVISDWLRDHGHDILADGVLELPRVQNGVRDRCYLDAVGAHREAIMRRVDEVIAGLNAEAKALLGGVCAVVVLKLTVEIPSVDAMSRPTAITADPMPWRPDGVYGPARSEWVYRPMTPPTWTGAGFEAASGGG